MNILNTKKLKAALLLAVCLTIFAPAASFGAWWDFGKKNDLPEVTDLKFNKFSADNVEERLTLGRDTLDAGMVIIRGRADAGDGVIGKVEISFDGGQKWQSATLGDRGNFTYEFKPTLGEEYEFRIKALSTTGKASDLEDHSFVFSVSEKSDEDAVRKAFAELLAHYMREDYSSFMALVSEDFEGNKGELEDAVSDDFSFFDNIRIDPSITRIVAFDNSYEVYFTFNRQLLATKSGTLLKDSAATSMILKREGDTFKLREMAAPLIFGVSNPSEIATSVTGESVGQEVIVVDRDGNASKNALPDQVQNISGGVPEENGTISTNFWYFDFDLGSEDSNNGDVMFEFNALFPSGGITELATSFDSTTQVPEGPYPGQPAFNLAVGKVFAVQRTDHTYVLMEITAVDPGNSVSFRYKHQTDGSRNF